jgi:hypothetical protein
VTAAIAPTHVSGTSDSRNVRWYQIGNFSHSPIWIGMKAMSRITPGIRRAITDGVMTAVTYPAASVAAAPIARRASIIGSVNVIASATCA